jgi:hypothetical protein
VITAVIIVAVLVYAAFQLDAGHIYHRYRKTAGLWPNFYWSSVRPLGLHPPAWRLPARAPTVARPHPHHGPITGLAGRRAAGDVAVNQPGRPRVL